MQEYLCKNMYAKMVLVSYVKSSNFATARSMQKNLCKNVVQKIGPFSTFQKIYANQILILNSIHNALTVAFRMVRVET